MVAQVLPDCRQSTICDDAKVTSSVILIAMILWPNYSHIGSCGLISALTAGINLWFWVNYLFDLILMIVDTHMIDIYLRILLGEVKLLFVYKFIKI